ncbi:MAG: UDP-3-O-(3-hydroxymyristoyl)glucosamine N-acyltransferase [Pseudomonadales bacterium]|nr:UDP-3-O-(3-hydroxymyristoyl)glucosamine N-acyltransferase [Pseudomonadales bacterium]
MAFIPGQSFTLAEIASALDLELRGDGGCNIFSIAPLHLATEKDISFLSNAKYAEQLTTTAAAAVIVTPEYSDACKIPALIADNPYLAFARLTALYDDLPGQKQEIHPSAVIADSAIMGGGVSIGANVVIGEDVVLGVNCVIEANTVVAARSSLGDNCRLRANVTIYHNVRLGKNVTIHSGTVIGSDGFGNVPTGEKTGRFWQKIHQLGGVLIGDDVEVGANTCIDRGALDDTIIENGVLIDNLVHIAHGCIIGENTALAACVAMAGSTYIGKRCTFGGGVGIAGHISIADDVHITGMAMVTGTIKEAGQYSSGTGLLPARQWRKSAVRFSQLDSMHQRLRKIEKHIEK